MKFLNAHCLTNSLSSRLVSTIVKRTLELALHYNLKKNIQYNNGFRITQITKHSNLSTSNHTLQTHPQHLSLIHI